MDDLSIVTLRYDVAGPDRTATKTPVSTHGLGPNQLNWLRSNIDAFRHAENQWALLRHDEVRAARIAGLI